ncbi:MAG TPA: DUF1329 domain-containing protein [Myxococcota bacterium]|nr:DUF1329 domain-containing protein [Myxococcota bacterium]
MVEPCPWLGIVLLSLLLLLPLSDATAEDADDAGPPPFREGDVIGVEQVERLRPYLPPEFWEHRDFFFYEGMRLEIGPFHRDYAPPPVWQEASERFRGQARIGPDESLEGYVSGTPFPPEAIDCAGDPQAGAKHAWNFANRWDGDGADARYLYSYWDRGEELPLFFRGTSKTVRLARRPEPSLLDRQGGDLIRGERRLYAFGIEVDAPFDARGVKLLTYRYKQAERPRSESRNDDTWVYVPTLRRVRRISTAQRTDAVSGTDFTFDDLASFSGIVPQYTWKCIGEQELLAPVNSRVRAYPYAEGHDFGPYGLSYADDRWELRRTIQLRMIPKNADHPYHHKDLYLDTQTYAPLYSFAYDQKQELWKIIWHAGRWSEDGFAEYQGWDEVPQPRDLRTVSDIVVNVQTGTGNRIEFWDNHGTPYRTRGQMRRYIDVGRLERGSN